MGMCVSKIKRKKNEEAVAQVAKLPTATVESYRESFALVDENKDGYITYDELGDIMATNNKRLTDEQLKTIIAKYDLNDDNMIDFEEFVLMMEKSREDEKRRHDELTVEELREMFNIIDENGDGFLTAPELKRMMLQLGEKATDQEVQDMMIRANTKTEGEITFEEFVVLMKQQKRG